MLKVTGRTMWAAGGLLPATVSADTGDEVDKKPAVAPLLRDELSLYTGPQSAEPRVRYAEPEPAGQLEQSVAALRKTAAPYTDWCRETYETIRPKVQSAVRFGNDTYAYLKDPPKDFYPRAGLIGFTGVLGLFLARGSRIKRLLYPVGLMTLSTSLYYPEQAARIAKTTGDSAYERAVQGYAAVERMIKTPGKDAANPAPKN